MLKSNSVVLCTGGKLFNDREIGLCNCLYPQIMFYFLIAMPSHNVSRHVTVELDTILVNNEWGLINCFLIDSPLENTK